MKNCWKNFVKLSVKKISNTLTKIVIYLSHRGLTQTVARVSLDRLGKDGVKLRKRRGWKLIAIDPNVAERVSTLAEAEAYHDCCNGEEG